MQLGMDGMSCDWEWMDRNGWKKILLGMDGTSWDVFFSNSVLGFSD